VLAITPFNFPLNLAAHKLGPALAVGAPVVLKPAPRTPLTALALADAVRAAGLPGGMLSVLPCDVDVADRLVRDPRFGVLSFTGSAAVGWTLRDRAHKKRVCLELGGNAAAVVGPDADTDWALGRIVTGGYAHAGQVCIKVQRVYVHESLAARVTEALVERVRTLAVVDPLDATGLCSCLIDEDAARRVETWLAAAVSAGARVLVGGTREGNRVRPAVVTGARPGMTLVDEEVFGPVVTVHPYRDLSAALAEIDRGRYGLQAGIFTHDLRAVALAFRALRVGALVVNDYPTFRVDAMPYGGVKDSGLGREGVRYAVEEFTEPRLLVVRGLWG
jgi:glyceraldehyde-3-phosphate dehydrogenase (NADP+)